MAAATQTSLATFSAAAAGMCCSDPKSSETPQSGHWQQQYQQIKKERDGFAHEKSAVEQLLADTKIEAAALIEKYAGLERQNQEKQKYIDEIQRQNQQIQANLEHYRASVLEQRTTEQQRYEQQQRQFEQTIRQANHELVEIRQENTALQQQYQRANFEKDGLKIGFDKLNTQYESVTTRLTETLNALAKKEGAQQHWQNQCSVLTTKFDEQNKSFVELQTKHAMLIQQSETTNEEIKKLRKQNSSLANEKWGLGQEKARLYGQLKQVESVKLSRV